jgi:hypothetical protein
MSARLYDSELADRTGTPFYTLDEHGSPVSHPPRQAWYSVQEAAKEWRVNSSTVLAWCRAGRFDEAAVQHGGRGGLWRLRGDLVERGRPSRWPA